MKNFPFVGNDEYLYDQSTNIVHYCKYLSDNCNLDHLTPNNSYLIPRSDDKPELTVMVKEDSIPIKCPFCYHK